MRAEVIELRDFIQKVISDGTECRDELNKFLVEGVEKIYLNNEQFLGKTQQAFQFLYECG